jgi:phosphoglycerol transferase MdoB-like AlkP superfamily enzyme
LGLRRVAMSESSSSSGGVGVLGLLGVAFVVLKLTGVINWSWWWVTAPFWGGFLFFVLVLMVIAFVAYKIQ